jgi:hypothetical protein
MRCPDDDAEIRAIRVRTGAEHRRILSALMSVAEEQRRIRQQRHRLADALQDLVDQDVVLILQQARLVDELQSLSAFPGVSALPAGPAPAHLTRPVRAAARRSTSLVRNFGDPGS